MAKVRIEPWRISLDGPVSDYSESLFAVGNGHLGMRGFSLQTPKRRPYDHAVFRAGFFEPIRPGVTDMVQLPDALGASWQALVYGALGLWSDGGELRLTPRLPPEIRGASLCVYHRGRRLRLTVRDGEGRIEQEG